MFPLLKDSIGIGYFVDSATYKIKFDTIFDPYRFTLFSFLLIREFGTYVIVFFIQFDLNRNQKTYCLHLCLKLHPCFFLCY